jgi:acetyl esterase/lipase
MAAGGIGFLKRLWVVLLLAAGFASAGRAQAGDAKGGEKTYPVQTIENIAYYEGKDADPVKHKLDLYVPKGKKGFAVLVFLHGGAWTIGDKVGLFGVHRTFARGLARHGIGVVCPNYRLSPRVTHPGHIRDVARAFAWTCKHIAQYGGRPDAVFVSGHSAGGHLAALLATDDRYLKAVGLTLKAVRGVLPISGVYRVPNPPLLVGVFGKDVRRHREASPITYARGDAPPFLLFCAQTELPSCEKASALAFCKALQQKKCVADFREIKDRNHVTILVKALSDQDPVTQGILAFVHKYTPPLPRPERAVSKRSLAP